MALELKETRKGIECKYWKIIDTKNDYIRNQTIVTLALFVDEKHSQTGLSNYLYFEKPSFAGTDLTRKTLYEKIKQPVYQTNSDPEKDDVQINPFVNSKDC